MKPITIVTGLPRSGTSMVMQILQAGGMPIATDKKGSRMKIIQKGTWKWKASLIN